MGDASCDSTRTAQLASICTRYQEIYDKADALGFKAIDEDLSHEDLKMAKLANILKNLSTKKKTPGEGSTRKSPATIECYSCGDANRCTYVKEVTKDD